MDFAKATTYQIAVAKAMAHLEGGQANEILVDYFFGTPLWLFVNPVLELFFREQFGKMFEIARDQDMTTRFGHGGNLKIRILFMNFMARFHFFQYISGVFIE